MANITKDFDRFIAEKEDKKITVRIFGRECTVPAELPWYYMLKVDALIRTNDPISGDENIKLVKHMLSPEDYEYVTSHPDFKPSFFWKLIAYIYLYSEEQDKPKVSEFKTEDDLKIEQTQASAPKKRRSAR